jgi:hypothetical protein
MKGCRRYAARTTFPLDPAFRLRLHAGLDYSVPTALGFLIFLPPYRMKTGSTL